MTKKFTEALNTARRNGVAVDRNNQESTYRALETAGYHWNSETGGWEHYPSMAADEASTVIRVRVWAESSIVGLMADGVVMALQQAGLRLVERSEPYACRPPKQLESRIYLTFEPGRMP